MASMIELYSDSGELVQYRPLSFRIRDFLGQYGPEKGYAVTTELVDTLSLKPGLMRLYAIALQAGRKPEERFCCVNFFRARLGNPCRLLGSQ